MYTSNSSGNSCSAIDSSTNTVVKTIEVMINPFTLLFNPTNDDPYVGNSFTPDANIAIVDGNTNTLEETLSVGSGPLYLEFNPDNKYVYTSNYLSDSLCDRNNGVPIVEAHSRRWA